MRQAVRRGVLGAVVVLVTTSGCSWVKDPDAADDGQGGAGSGQGDGAAPPTLSSEPVDGLPTAFDNPGAVTFEETDVSEAWAGGDQVLTLAPDAVRSRVLPALEVDWRFSSGGGELTDLLVDAEAGVVAVVQVEREAGEGTAVGDDTVTVTTVDLESGESLESAVVEVPRDPEAGAAEVSVRLVGLDDDRALVDVASADGAVATAIAFDLTDGEALWARPRSEALALTDDTAVLGTWSDTQAGAVVAVDVDSGAERWAALEGTRAGSVVGVAGGGAGSVTVATTSDPEAADDAATVTQLALADGEAGEPTPVRGWDWSCSPTDVTDAVVCTVADQKVVIGWDLDAARATWQLPDEGRFAPVVTAVEDDLVYGLLDTGVGVVLDAATGEDVAADTGAGPVAVDRWGGVVLYQARAVLFPAFDRPAEDATDDATDGQ